MLRRADHVIPGLDISIPSNWSARRHSFAINHQHPGDPAKLGPAIHSFKPHVRPSHRFDCLDTDTLRRIAEKNAFVRAETESCARRRPLRATEQRRRAMLRVNALTDNLRARSRACCTARRRRLGGGAWTIIPDNALGYS